MLVGSIRLTACSPAFCDATDIPVPETPFTTATATYTVTTDFSFLDGRIYNWKANLVGYPFCTFNTLWEWKTRLTLGGTPFSNPVESWNVESESTGSATWTKTATTTVTGSGASGGSWKRPSDGTVLATGIAWKAYEYTFTRTARSGSHVQYAVTTASYQQRSFCCENVYPPTYVDYDSLVPGSVASRTPTSPPASYTMRWAGAATTQVAGLNLTLKTAGTSLAPWFVDVAGGAVVLTDKNGSSTSYTGTLSSVAASINAAGKFTAAVPSNVTSAAKTSDLRPYHSPPLEATTCTVGVPLVLVGDVLAPSTTGAYFGNFTFADGFGYPDTEAGLEQFMRAPWYPKSTSFYFGNYYYIYGEFDLWLSPTPGSWSKTPGASTRTDVQIFPADTTDVFDRQLLSTRCKPIDEAICSEVFNFSCNGSNGSVSAFTPYLTDCTGFPFPAGCFDIIPLDVCWCWSEQRSTIEYEQVVRTATQVMTGSFVIS